MVGFPAEQAPYLQHMQTGCGHQGPHDGTKRPGRKANHTPPHLAVIKGDWSCLCGTHAKGQLYFTATYSHASQGVSPSWFADLNFVCNLISSTRAVCATHLIFVDSLRLIRKTVPSVLRKRQPLELLLRNSEH